MKQTTTEPDGTVIITEGTPEELAEFVHRMAYPAPVKFSTYVGRELPLNDLRYRDLPPGIKWAEVVWDRELRKDQAPTYPWLHIYRTGGYRSFEKSREVKDDEHTPFGPGEYVDQTPGKLIIREMWND